MPQGLEILNDAQTVQIGLTPPVFGMSQKIIANSVVGIFAPLGYSMSTWSITVTGINPVCAFACSTHGVLFNGSRVSGNEFTFYFASRTAPIGTPCTFYVFDSMYQIATYENVGLETFDGSGRRIFHSSVKPMKAAKSNTGQAAWFGGFGWSWSMFQGHAIYNANDIKIVEGAATINSEVYHYWDVYSPPYFGNGSGSTGPGFLLDVTGY